MADNRRFSPERELLNLIEDGKKVSGGSSLKIKRQSLSFITLGGLKGRILFLKENFQKYFKAKSIELATLNRLLVAVLFLLVLAMVTQIVFSSLEVKKNLALAFNVERRQPLFEFKQDAPLKSINYYLDKAKKRNIFNMGGVEIVAEPEDNKREAQQKITSKVQDLRLVGISWSDNPDAMIEDGKLQKTFFVKNGDTINEIKVEEIRKESILLSFAGEEFELK